MMIDNPPVYTLVDCGEEVTVRPCRKCGTVPIFYYADSGYFETNLYIIKCPNCGMGKMREWEPKDVEEAWNDWSISMEEWEADYCL